MNQFSNVWKLKIKSLIENCPPVGDPPKGEKLEIENYKN